ncbi:uncharacterized protein LOC141652310 [Silene latifolia]|uniref:uncharacterized protein LOC141652310 n=1 Tax=Silene latifolia TaxID=37657 RepID=UPI003D78969C
MLQSGILLTASYYHVWGQRNNARINAVLVSPGRVVQMIKDSVRHRIKVKRNDQMSSVDRNWLCHWKRNCPKYPGDVKAGHVTPVELYAEIREKQKGDPKLEKWRSAVEEGVPSRFVIGVDDGLSFGGSWCVPDDEELERKILTEAHSTPYSMHPGGDKLYKDLKKTFWWPGMKKEVAEFVSRCLDTWSKAELAKAYVRSIVKLHGIPKDIVSDRDSRWVDGETIQILEDMLRACVLEFGRIMGREGVMRFGKRGKLSQKYIGPYEILDRIGEAAYHLALPPALARVHNVFHVSQLRKYVSDPTHVLEVEIVEMDENLSYEEVAKEILDRKVRKTRNSEVVLVKVLWFNHNVEEATWGG